MAGKAIRPHTASPSITARMNSPRALRVELKSHACHSTNRESSTAQHIHLIDQGQMQKLHVQQWKWSGIYPQTKQGACLQHKPGRSELPRGLLTAQGTQH